jgi:hypothetical protein
MHYFDLPDGTGNIHPWDYKNPMDITPRGFINKSNSKSKYRPKVKKFKKLNKKAKFRKRAKKLLDGLRKSNFPLSKVGFKKLKKAILNMKAKGDL